MESSLYDVAAKPEEGVQLTREELKPRLQSLLRRRFNMAAHSEVRPARGYALVVAPGGPHLTPTRGDHFPGFRINVSPGQMRGANWSMATFAKYLSPNAGFPVVDQTDIAGSFDIDFTYASTNGPDTTLPPLETALRQATGLSLKPQKVPVDTIVIDSIAQVPTEIDSNKDYV